MAVNKVGSHVTSIKGTSTWYFIARLGATQEQMSAAKYM